MGADVKPRSRGPADGEPWGPSAEPLTGAAWVEPLLAWFSREGRRLPWRSRDATWYHVVVAEMALIRTRVAAALRVYEEVVGRYPGPAELCSRASPEELRRIFSSIGLPRRGEWLYETVCTLHRMGGVPCDEGVLRGLPGVGRYLARLLLARFCGAHVGFADANVVRVLSRLYCRRLRVEEAEELLERVVPRGRMVEVVAALIDLAAAYCRPRSPRCRECPLARFCCSLRASHR